MQNYKDGKWANRIIAMQHPDGSWGCFHTLRGKSDSLDFVLRHEDNIYLCVICFSSHVIVVMIAPGALPISQHRQTMKTFGNAPKDSIKRCSGWTYLLIKSTAKVASLRGCLNFAQVAPLQRVVKSML